jgi:hypothetical protein
MSSRIRVTSFYPSTDQRGERALGCRPQSCPRPSFVSQESRTNQRRVPGPIARQIRDLKHRMYSCEARSTQVRQWVLERRDSNPPPRHYELGVDRVELFAQ